MDNVSIVLPVFNGGKFLLECVQSILAQTFKNFVLVVVDDESTDNSAALIKSIQDPRVEYHLVPHGGTVSTRKFGIKASKGSWVAFCDQDDRWLPEKLEKQMEQVKGYDLIHTDAVLLKDGKHRGTFWNSLPSVPGRGSKDLIPQFLCRNQINNSSVLLKREWANKVEAIPIDPNICMDIDYSLWLELLYQGARFTYIVEPLVEYRVHDQQQSFSKLKSRLWQRDVIKDFLRRHPDIVSAYPFRSRVKLLKSEIGLAFSKLIK